MIHSKSPPGGPEAAGSFRLGDLRIDPVAGQIDGPGGAEQVDPKVMEVFAVLARRPGELVTREELMDSAWPDRVVTDDVLSRCIYQLRRHLMAASGDEGLHDLVETLPRRGYRLNGDVAPDKQILESRRTPWRSAAILSVLALVAASAWWAWQGADREAAHRPHAAMQPVVAVLPFVDLSAEGDHEYFADGVSEELLNTLARIPSLRVIARSSAFQFREQSPDIATVAGRLNATHVLEGAVRKTGNRVRISAQLVDAADSHHMWSDTFERELDDIFAIQDEVALAVARALELNLVPADLERGAPASSAAYTHFLQGQFLFNRRGSGDLERAAAQYRRALDIDPDFARAWAGLAGVHHIQIAEGEISDEAGLPLMGEAAKRALELDPEDPVALYRAAIYHWASGDRERADSLLEAAIRHGENHSLILGIRAGRAKWEGRFDEAAELQRQALALDPLAVIYHSNLAYSLLAAGRFAESRDAALSALALRPESGDDLRRSTSTILIAVGVLDGRAGEVLSLLENWPEGDSSRDMYAALVYDSLGRTAEAGAMMERLAAGADFMDAVRLAKVFAHRGEADAAFSWLGTALERLQGSSAMRRFGLSGEFIHSPFLAPLKDDPRWEQWLEEYLGGLL